jgi:hypothetical protein
MGERAEAASRSSWFVVLPCLATIRQQALPSLRVVRVISGFLEGIYVISLEIGLECPPPIKDREIFHGSKLRRPRGPVIRGLNDFPCFFLLVRSWLPLFYLSLLHLPFIHGPYWRYDHLHIKLPFYISGLFLLDSCLHMRDSFLSQCIWYWADHISHTYSKFYHWNKGRYLQNCVPS